jgi:hypothetical protein
VALIDLIFLDADLLGANRLSISTFSQLLRMDPGYISVDKTDEEQRSLQVLIFVPFYKSSPIFKLLL